VPGNSEGLGARAGGSITTHAASNFDWAGHCQLADPGCMETESAWPLPPRASLRHGGGAQRRQQWWVAAAASSMLPMPRPHALRAVSRFLHGHSTIRGPECT
jgi:hypothetical protein